MLFQKTAWIFFIFLNIVSFNMMHWSEWPSFKHPRTKPLVCMDWRMLNVECYKLSCCLFVVCWIPRCKLSCCLSRSAPCCTCTLRTSPGIESQVSALSVIYDIVPTMILSLWYCSDHDIVILILFLPWYCYCDLFPPWYCVLPWMDPCTSSPGADRYQSCYPQPVRGRKFLGEKHDWSMKNVVSGGW